MQPIYITKTIGIAGSTNAVASISTAATPVVTLAASNLPLDTARRLVMSSTAADTSSLRLTITGTTSNGTIISETIQGSTTGAGTVTTTRSDFYTVTAISESSANNVLVVVGTSSQAGTPWQLVNWHTTPINLAAAVTLNSTAASVTWEFTLDDPTRTYPNPTLTVPSVFASTGIVGAVGGSSNSAVGSTGSLTVGAISFPVAAWRMTLTSTSSTYSLTGTVLQAGID